MIPRATMSLGVLAPLVLTLSLTGCELFPQTEEKRKSTPGHEKVPGSSDGLVAEWTFTDGSLADTWGDYSLTASGNPSGAADRSGDSDSAYFFGAGAYASVSGAAVMTLPTTLSLSFWLRPERVDTGSHTIFMAGNGSDDVSASQFHLQHTGSAGFSVFYAGSGGSSVSLGNPSLGLNEWTHFVLTWNRSSGAYVLYADADAVSSGTLPTADTSVSPTEWSVGSRAHGLQARLDDVRLYDQILTETQVEWLYDYPQEAPDQLDPSLQGVIGEWLFEGGSLVDTRGRFTMTAVGSPTSVAGHSGDAGSALDFVASGDYLQTAFSDATALSTSLSISLWLKPAAVDTGSHSLFMIGDETGEVSESLFHWQHTGTAGMSLFFPPNESSVSLGNPSLEVGSWVHLAFTWNRTTNAWATYKDGSLLSSGTFGTSPSTISDMAYLTLGGRAFNLNGTLDDVRFYNRVLSDSEVATLAAE